MNQSAFDLHTIGSRTLVLGDLPAIRAAREEFRAEESAAPSGQAEGSRRVIKIVYDESPVGQVSGAGKSVYRDYTIEFSDCEPIEEVLSVGELEVAYNTLRGAMAAVANKKKEDENGK